MSRTDTERRAAVDHAAALIESDGLSANAAASAAGDKAGVSGRTVYRWADSLNIDLGQMSHDVAKTRIAVATHAAQYEARRAELRAKFLDAVEWCLNQIGDGTRAADAWKLMGAARHGTELIRLEEGKATSRTAELPSLADVETWLAQIKAQRAEANA